MNETPRTLVRNQRSNGKVQSRASSRRLPRACGTARLMSKKLNNVSVEGAVFAFAAGAIGGLGVALLGDDDVRRLVKRTLGGGLLVVASYLWAPASLRRAWLD